MSAGIAPKDSPMWRMTKRAINVVLVVLVIAVVAILYVVQPGAHIHLLVCRGGC